MIAFSIKYLLSYVHKKFGRPSLIYDPRSHAIVTTLNALCIIYYLNALCQALWCTMFISSRDMIDIIISRIMIDNNIE